jgi:uncharacterized protein (TIGR03382 family)
MLSLLPLLASSSLPVIGGTPVEAGEWPDAVAVLSRTAACTGTLIAPDVVLTAGHCIDDDPVVALVGSVDFGRPGGEAIRIRAALAYPDWRRSYDVGIVVLDHAAAAPSRAVAAACTAREYLVEGSTVRLVGFGLTRRSGTGDNTRLHEARIPVVDATCSDDPACNPRVSPGGEFTAGGDGPDACFGDSGGPVYLDTPAGPALIGVVSRGEAITDRPCGDGGIYVRADKVVSWIQRVTGEAVERTRCAGAGDEGGLAGWADPSGEVDIPDGGCAAGGGAGGTMVIALGVLAAARLYRRRSRVAQSAELTARSSARDGTTHSPWERPRSR